MLRALFGVAPGSRGRARRDRADDDPAASWRSWPRPSCGGARQGPARPAGPLPARPDRALPRPPRRGRARSREEELALNPRDAMALYSSAMRTSARRGGTRPSPRCSSRSGSTRSTAGPTSCSGAAYLKKGSRPPPRACCGGRSSTTRTTGPRTTCSASSCSRRARRGGARESFAHGRAAADRRGDDAAARRWRWRGRVLRHAGLDAVAAATGVRGR